MKSATPTKVAATAPSVKAATVAPSPREQPSNRLWSQLATQPSDIRIGDVASAEEQHADAVAHAATGQWPEHVGRIDANAGGLQVVPETAQHIHAPDSGKAISPAIRHPVEQEVGRDLSHARLHDASADRLHADAMGARAFAFGNHIFLGSRGSPHDQRLISHELAHVAHASPGVVHRDPDPAAAPSAPAPAPAPPVTPPPSAPPPAAPAAARAAAPAAPTTVTPNAADESVVELKGAGTFHPPPALAKELQESAQAWQDLAALAVGTAAGAGTGTAPVVLPPSGGEKYVHVRFGEIADGVIPVRWTAQGYETPEPKAYFPAWGITLRHQAFPRVSGAEPTLWIQIQKSVVTGGMGWMTPVSLAQDAQKFKEQFPLSSLFGGLSGFQNVKLYFIVNKLAGGAFTYTAMTEFDDDAYHGAGSIRVADENYTFDGGIYVPVNGLPGNAKIPIKREPSGTLSSLVSGTVTWKFDRKIDTGRLSASVTATLTNGAIDIRGFGTYSWRDPKDPERRIDGKVTIVITNFDDAQQAVRDQLGPDAPATIVPAADDEELAITGWGQLDLTLSDWISGNAEVIVHPEGYVTARGEIRPKKVIKISDQHQKEWTLFDPPAIGFPIAGVPVVGDMRVEADTKITASASFGPGTLHNLRITGLISSDPNIINRFEVGGTISAPGEAALHLIASVGLSAKLLHAVEVSSAKIVADGMVRVKLYVEADAALGRRPSKKDPAISEYYLQAHALATAGLEFAVKLKAAASVLLAEIDLDLADRVWQIGGTGAELDVTYVFGRGNEKESELSAKFSDAKFDDRQFTEAVARGDKVKTKKDYKGDQVAETKSESGLTNPDAPKPFAPPDPSAPADPAAASGVTPANPDAPAPSASALVKVLDEPFEMNGESHNLYLALTDPATIEMASPPPRENLFKKIRRARERLEKEQASGSGATAARSVQLASLRTIELQATQVVVAAVRISESSPYLEPSVPGYHQLAALIHEYGDKFSVTDLSTALTNATADPDKPESVLQKYPKLAEVESHRALVARIIEQGVSATTLKAIFGYCNSYGYKDDQAETLLLNIFHMSSRRIGGYLEVLNEMASQRTKTKGGEFVLRYIGGNNQWGGHVLLEAKEDDPNSDRRWDAWIEGTLYEFKAWRSWSDALDKAFLRQIVQDHDRVKTGMDMPLRWIFNGEISLSTIHTKAEAAIRKERARILEGKSTIPNANLKMMDTILSQLRNILRVHGLL